MVDLSLTLANEERDSFMLAADEIRSKLVEVMTNPQVSRQPKGQRAHLMHRALGVLMQQCREHRDRCEELDKRDR